MDGSPAAPRPAQETLDEVVLVRSSVADGLSFPHLGERFLALLGFQQLDRRLDGLADLGPYRLAARARLLREARSRRPTRSSKDR